jgi:hypothetical protein
MERQQEIIQLQTSPWSINLSGQARSYIVAEDIEMQFTDLESFEQAQDALSDENLQEEAKNLGILISETPTRHQLIAEITNYFRREYEETHGENQETLSNSIRIDKKAFSIRGLKDMISRGDIRLAPDFQRRKVWTSAQKSRLVESILLDIPLPYFYAVEADDACIDIVDGLQRLSTLNDFVHNKFALDKLEKAVNASGKRFSELPGPQRRRVLISMCDFFVIHHSTPKEVTIDIFNRLNTGGAPLTGQEVRHAIGGADYRNLTRDMVARELFKELMPKSYTLEGSSRWNRMQDLEAVTRFIAFRKIKEIENYRPSFKTFLTKAVTSLRQEPKSVYNSLNEDFDLALRNAEVIFAENESQNAFLHWPGSSTETPHKNKAFRITLFETWLVNLADYEHETIKKHSTKIKNQAREWMDNEEYVESYTKKTTSRDQIKKRFQVSSEILSQIIGQ